MEYEKYDTISNVYDNTRKTMNTHLNIILSHIKENDNVIDLGCGTGNCLCDISQNKTNCSFTGMDFSKGMLSIAKEKQKNGLLKNTKWVDGSVIDTPFANNEFDVIIVNQMVHHLDTYTNIIKAFKEIHRIGKPKSIFLINTTYPNQVKDGFWWADLIPQAIDLISKRFPTKEWLFEILPTLGFSIEDEHIIYEPLMDIKKYLNYEGPLQLTYRNGDSTWSLSPDNEQQECVLRWEKYIKDKTAKERMEKRDLLRLKCGQSVTLKIRINK